MKGRVDWVVETGYLSGGVKAGSSSAIDEMKSQLESCLEEPAQPERSIKVRPTSTLIVGFLIDFFLKGCISDTR